MASHQLTRLRRMLRNRKAPGPSSVESERLEAAQLARMFPVDGDVTVRPVDADGVAAEWVVPPDVDETRCLLYLHGGGYCTASCATHRALVARLARASGIRALSLEYRLAPENPFPAAVEDAFAAYRWLLSRGTASQRIVVAGDSAGGGLAASLLVRTRDEGLGLPAGAVLFSPWVDLTDGSGASASATGADPLVRREAVAHLARWYLGGADPADPLASPLFADLRGLPPLLIMAGGDEALLADSTRLADRARASGVDVTLDVWEGLFHVWPLYAPILPEGRAAVEKAAAFARACLEGAP